MTVSTGGTDISALDAKWFTGSGEYVDVSALMFRKKLIEILNGNPMTVSQIARLVDESPGRIADDLNHLFRSLKHTDYKAVLEPARCRACGFEFSTDKLTKPSKCPECHGTWVLEPRVGIENKNPS